MPDQESRPLLPEDRIATAALRKMAAYHSDVVAEVEKAVAESPLVVVGMAQNPHVRNVRNALEAAGFEYRYIGHGSYLSEWRKRLAIKLWSGWPTFPQVFVRGMLIGGEDLTKAAIEDGSLSQMLQGPA